MPISNPIIQGLTVNIGADLILANTDPTIKPDMSKVFWFNSETNKLFISSDNQSVLDWEQIASPSNAVSRQVLSTNTILESNSRYFVNEGYLVCTLPDNPALGDTIDISNGDFFSFRLNNGSATQYIFYNGAFSSTGIDSGLDLKNYADCQLIYQGANLWRVTYANREIIVFDGNSYFDGLPYIATESESYAYYFTNTIDKINDGNLTYGVMKIGGGTDYKFIVKCTFSQPTKLNNIRVIGGQFNGLYNRPDEVRVYSGDSIDPVDLLNEFTDLGSTNNNTLLAVDNSAYLTEYTLEFTSLIYPTVLSISELFLYGDIL